MNIPAPSGIPEAVTAAILVGDEILLVHRNPKLHAFAGYEAFAGGKVEAGDDAPCCLACARDSAQDSVIPPRRVNALVREIREELGFDLVALEQAGELTAFGEVGYALTPPIAPRRFSTWFYRLRLRHKPALTLNPPEHTAAGWATPAAWLARYAAGDLLLVPPTRFALQDLADNPETTQLSRMDAIGKPPTGGRFIEIQPLGGITILAVPSNTLPPAHHTNCFLIGDGTAEAPRLLVDPSPKDDATLAALIAQVEGRCDAVFITHHHPDHHERADALARRCNLPIWLSADTRTRIAIAHPHFFDGIPVRELADGETLTRWLGHPVHVLAVPGHDAGQLALLPDNRAWCLVGDLIQGIGTVVIAPPEGDMARYFKTLEHVIALAPRVIFPSHGMALGGTHYLEAALAHRRLREGQILALHRSGKSEDEILAVVYAGTPPPLLPYARVNIRSHLTKLDAEQRLG
ncbi:MAG: MBL fold metallo-hydrolase [Nevskiaceae bacterium]|nr:MAG: MBL fold metallo-hydrolase [Nevskiaceae bacterium]TBR73253.1 MAG: MBL fold metallo-hydrolase [Nevskiaceae bacterium]